MIPRYLTHAYRKSRRDRRVVAYLTTALTFASERQLLKSIGVDPGIRAAWFAGVLLREALNPNAPPMAA